MLTLATFNVKDLLTPRGERERAILPAKLEFIARMVRATDADVIGLQEVGPEDLVGEIVRRLSDRAYGPPILGTADTRGIRCALLSRFPVVESRVHTAEALPFPVFREGDPPPFGRRIPLRRGIVHARIEAPGLGLIDVLVAHFKSSRPVPPRDASGGELPTTTTQARAEATVRSLVWRAAEALFVRGLVDGLTSPSDREIQVAVVGDLNDTPDSPPLRALRGEGPGELFDCAAGIEERARYSTLHDGHPSQIDHVLASAPLHARLQSAHFLNAELRCHAPLPPARPETRDLDVVPTIDSDHAPLVTRFG